MEKIITAALTGGLPAIVTLITSLLHAKTAARNAAKQSILQMILEDHVAAAENRIPTNYQNILHEFDIYTAKGGNSYVHDKVEEYKKWFADLEETKKVLK